MSKPRFYLPNVDREKSEHLLKNENRTSFLIRDSSITGRYVLSHLSLSPFKIDHQLLPDNFDLDQVLKRLSLHENNFVKYKVYIPIIFSD